MNGSDLQPNPYRATAHVAAPSDDEIVNRPPGVMAAAIIEGCLGLFAAWAAPAVIGQFEELYKGFGAELPGATQFLLATRYGWLIFLIIAGATLVWVGIRPTSSRGELRRQVWAIAAFVILLFIAVFFSIYALYLPMFQLGAVV